MAQYFTDFSEYAKGTGVPEGTTLLAGTGSKFAVVEDLAATGESALTLTIGGTSESNILTFDGYDATASATREIYAVAKASTKPTVWFPVIVNASAPSGSRNGYWIGFFAGSFIIRRYSNNTATTLQAVTRTWSANTYYKFRAWVGLEDRGFGLNQRVKGKFWLASLENEPAGWDLDFQTTTSPVITAGGVGIQDYSASQVVTYDIIGIATEGDSAPVEPVPDPEPEPEAEPVTNAGHYTLTITGTPPVLLPCANFLARLRSGRRSYLQATIPYTSAVADIVTSRQNEDLELRYYDTLGTEHIVITVKIDGIQLTQGIQSSSIVMNGWRQTTNATPATHTDIQAMILSSGTFTATMTMPGYRPEIKPADTVESGSVSFTANLVTIQAAARRNDIEVRTTIVSTGGTLSNGKLFAPKLSVRPLVSAGPLLVQHFLVAPQLSVTPAVVVGTLSATA